MKNNSIDQAIKEATDLVKDIKDNDLRLKTYELILNRLLNNIYNKSPNQEFNNTANNQDVTNNELSENKDYYFVLSKNLGIEKEILSDFVEFEKGELNLLFSINRDSDYENQIIFTLIYLMIKKASYDVKEINSSILRDKLSIKGISLSTSLSTNIKKHSSLIHHKSGKRGSKKTSYILTSEGYAKGINIFKQLVKGESLKDMQIDFFENKTSKSRKNSNLSKQISILIKDGFFDNFKSVTDCRNELNKRGIFRRRQDIDAYLRQVLLGKVLYRERKDKKWKYVIKK